MPFRMGGMETKYMCFQRGVIVFLSWDYNLLISRTLISFSQIEIFQ